MGRVPLAVTLVVLVAGPAAAAPSAAGRTGTCDTRAATMTFVAGKAVVMNADGRTLATATQKRRSISGSCQSSARHGVARHLLDGDVPRGKKVRCSSPGPRVVVETEPVRNANGRVIGNRLALWMSGIAGAVAEAVVAGKRSWFSYSKTFCHTV